MIDQNKNDLGRLEKLKKGLYANKKIVSRGFSGLHAKKYDVEENWGDGKIPPETMTNFLSDMPRKSIKEKNWIEKFLIFSIILFVVAAGAVLFTVLGGVNRMSTSNVDISVIGPASIESGGELSLQLTIENNCLSKNQHCRYLDRWILYLSSDQGTKIHYPFRAEPWFIPVQSAYRHFSLLGMEP